MKIKGYLNYQFSVNVLELTVSGFKKMDIRPDISSIPRNQFSTSNAELKGFMSAGAACIEVTCDKKTECIQREGGLGLGYVLGLTPSMLGGQSGPT